MRLAITFTDFSSKLDWPTPVYVRDVQKWKIGKFQPLRSFLYYFDHFCQKMTKFQEFSVREMNFLNQFDLILNSFLTPKNDYHRAKLFQKHWCSFLKKWHVAKKSVYFNQMCIMRTTVLAIKVCKNLTNTMVFILLIRTGFEWDISIVVNLKTKTNIASNTFCTLGA